MVPAAGKAADAGCMKHGTALVKTAKTARTGKTGFI